MSEALTVCLPAWTESSIACLATCEAISSTTRLSSSAASSLTLSAPDFLIIRYTAARPNSVSDNVLESPFDLRRIF